MRRVFTTVAAAVLCTIASATSPLRFGADSRNLGKVARKSRTQTVFRFVHDTPEPVVRTEAISSCGCTQVRFSPRPVMPGAEDSLTVVFNAKERGAFYKKIIIVTSSGRQSIAVRGMVE